MSNCCINDRCNSATRNPGQLCLKCRSDQLFPTCNYHEFRQASIKEIQYCTKVDAPVMAIDKYYFCSICKYNQNKEGENEPRRADGKSQSDRRKD